MQTISHTRGTTVGDPLTLTDDDGAALDLTGCTVTAHVQVGGTWGWAPHVRQGQALTDNERDLYHRMPGQPLGTFLIDIP